MFASVMKDLEGRKMCVKDTKPPRHPDVEELQDAQEVVHYVADAIDARRQSLIPSNLMLYWAAALTAAAGGGIEQAKDCLDASLRR